MSLGTGVICHSPHGREYNYQVAGVVGSTNSGRPDRNPIYSLDVFSPVGGDTESMYFIINSPTQMDNGIPL